MGEEADRLIEKFTEVPQQLKRNPYKGVAVVVKGVVVKVEVGKNRLLVVRMTAIGSLNEALYYCSSDVDMTVGSIVGVDADFKAYPYSSVEIEPHPADERLDILFAKLEEENNTHPTTAVSTNTVCSYCQQKGLHWSGKKGVNLHLRDENGFVHDCGRSKVTINL